MNTGSWRSKTLTCLHHFTYYLVVIRQQFRVALAYLDHPETGLAEHLNPLTDTPFQLEKLSTGFRLRADISGQEKPATLDVGETLDVAPVTSPDEATPPNASDF